MTSRVPPDSYAGAAGLGLDISLIFRRNECGAIHDLTIFPGDPEIEAEAQSTGQRGSDRREGVP